MPKRNLIWVGVVILVALAAIALTRTLQPPLRTEQPFLLLQRVDQLARQNYPAPVPPEALEQAAEAYLQALDPWSQFIPPRRQEDLRRIVDGERVGLGLHYEIRGGQVRVVGAVPNSPAAGADLAPGETVLSIDRRILRNPTREAVDALLDGEAGEPVTLRVAALDDPDAPLREIELVRREYPVETVTGLYRDATGRWQFLVDEAYGIAYVRLREFTKTTGRELEAALASAEGTEVQAIVLDLRGNPGGPLPIGVDVADRFLESGLILVKHSREGVDRYEAHRDRTHSRLRVVVLVDGHTASAAEVVAGSLQQHRRAMLVGEPTLGKNLIQTPFPLPDDMGTVMLTTGRYFFVEPPETQSDSAAATRDAAESASLQPDVLVELDEPARAELRELRYRMEVLPPRVPATQPAEPTAVQRDLSRWMEIDRPLGAALDLLRESAEPSLSAVEP